MVLGLEWLSNFDPMRLGIIMDYSGDYRRLFTNYWRVKNSVD